jgi:hypothetical protein
MAISEAAAGGFVIRFSVGRADAHAHAHAHAPVRDNDLFVNRRHLDSRQAGH